MFNAINRDKSVSCNQGENERAERSEWEALRLHLHSTARYILPDEDTRRATRPEERCGKHRLRGARYRVNTKTGPRNDRPSISKCLRERRNDGSSSSSSPSLHLLRHREIAEIWRLCYPPRVLERSYKMKKIEFLHLPFTRRLFYAPLSSTM